jgi:C-terminal processing protease CtpA/Prc
MKILKTLALLFVLSLLTTSCFNDDVDDNLITNSEINDFVWKSLNLWYFWQDDVQDLADDRFTTDQEYTDFLNSFASPRDLFDHLKFSSEDRFSVIVDDYNALLNSFSGVEMSNGVEFGLFTIDNEPPIYGIVRYILPNSDASDKDIKRGDLFIGVDGVELNADNFESLLFGESSSYTLNMATISNDEIVPNGKEVFLTKEVYTENPVYISKTIDVGGTKIGYLMYNRFTSDFDQQLNAAFGEFQATGIDELVLDLRYNPGGRVSSAKHLSSMITGQFTGQLFLKERWNDKVQSSLSPELLEESFVDELTDGTSINSLNLEKVYVLAQRSSASASELLINCLNPYIDVIHIGGNTRGKNEFSLTLLDVPSCSYVFFDGCDDNPNPNHTWGIQPLVGRNENSVGFLDYDEEGLAPDIAFPEVITDFGMLGEIDEPLLARAIQVITGSGRMAPVSTDVSYQMISDSKMYTPMRDNMYVVPDKGFIRLEFDK